jgi:hypothetical protein
MVRIMKTTSSNVCNLIRHFLLRYVFKITNVAGLYNEEKNHTGDYCSLKRNKWHASDEEQKGRKEKYQKELEEYFLCVYFIKQM